MVHDGQAAAAAGRRGTTKRCRGSLAALRALGEPVEQAVTQLAWTHFPGGGAGGFVEDNDHNGIIDGVDLRHDGVCDCLRPSVKSRRGATVATCSSRG
jgi:hypothetical protein